MNANELKDHLRTLFPKFDKIDETTAQGGTSIKMLTIDLLQKIQSSKAALTAGILFIDHPEPQLLVRWKRTPNRVVEEATIYFKPARFSDDADKAYQRAMSIV